MKCLICFIFGHKWFVKSFDEKVMMINGREFVHRDSKFSLVSHCERCGEASPDFRLK